MKNKKTILVIVAVVAVCVAAGAAFAYGGRHPGGGRGPGYGQGYEQGYGHNYGHCPAMRPGSMQGGPMQGGPRHGGPRQHEFRGGRGDRYMNVEIPQNIRDKQVEAAKLRIDLRAEMSKPQVDKAKALDIWKKQRALRDEISEWFFTQKLERIAERPATPQQQPAQTQNR